MEPALGVALRAIRVVVGLTAPLPRTYPHDPLTPEAFYLQYSAAGLLRRTLVLTHADLSRPLTATMFPPYVDYLSSTRRWA